MGWDFYGIFCHQPFSLLRQTGHGNLILFNNLLQTTFNHFIIFAAGHATESFTDFVVGHGELWSAQMLAAVVRKVQQLYALCY